MRAIPVATSVAAFGSVRTFRRRWAVAIVGRGRQHQVRCTRLRIWRTYVLVHLYALNINMYDVDTYVRIRMPDTLYNAGGLRTKQNDNHPAEQMICSGCDRPCTMCLRTATLALRLTALGRWRWHVGAITIHCGR